MEREQLGAQVSNTDPKPRWGLWENVRRSLSWDCMAPRERLAWDLWEGHFDGEIDI